MRKLLLSCNCVSYLLVACNTIGYSQTAEQNKITVYLQSGLIQQTSTDHLLNYYDYSGKTVMPISLGGFYFKNKNLFTLSLLFGQSAKLEPLNALTKYYEFNYIQHTYTEFKLEYFREVIKYNKHISAYLGVSNSAYGTYQQENYKSLLSGTAEGYRKSYDVSPLSLLAALLTNVHFNRSNLVIKGSFSILNYTARPDDNYVKQIGLPNSFNGKWYNPTDYRAVFFSSMYQYHLSHGIGGTAEFNILYRTYPSNGDYRYLMQSFLIGVNRTF